MFKKLILIIMDNDYTLVKKPLSLWYNNSLVCTTLNIPDDRIFLYRLKGPPHMFCVPDHSSDFLKV